MSYRIVVADKDPRSRDEVARYLLAQDNEFINVSSSGELKQAIKSQKPDLIILNAVLEDAPGWRLVTKIKDSKEYANIPILLMTGDPGGPPPAQVHSTGADRYLSKPIDGTVLRRAVDSLLGISSSDVVEDADEEILIDFTDEDSGDMTEELLAMSNVAMQHDDGGTSVGDTVEIDTGTLVAELDHPGEAGEETYEDTVRLNLEDMGLEDELDEGNSFEPTIELISDIPAETPGVDEEALDLKPDSDETLPDFSTIDSQHASPEYAGKDSVTVDMDVDELGLELDSEEAEESLPTGQSVDLDDTEIGQILEVQEPSKVLTSEDLFLDDDSLVKDTSASTGTTTEVDVIDLEEDTELREIEIEELEPVHADEEAGLGLDLDESTDTMPVEDLEMEQLANEDLEDVTVGEVTLEEGPDLVLDVEPRLEAAEGEDELTLEETGPEEITTQEFFGEELPTEEFPTEKFPEDKTGEVGLEQEISLEDVAFEQELALEAQTAPEIPLEELTLDTASAEEILFEQTQEEEPMLEVTEDISFDEITLHEFPETPPEDEIAEPAPAPPREKPAVVPPLAFTPAAAAFENEPAVAVAPEKPWQPELAPAAPAPEAAPPTSRAFGPDIAEIVAAVTGSKVGEAMPTRAQFAESVDTVMKGEMPSKDELFEAYNKAVRPAVPSKEEVLETVVKGIAASIPSREEISSRIDQMIAAQLPSREAVAQKVDNAIKDALPSPEEVMARLDKVLQELPSAEEINTRFDGAMGALPTSEDLLERIETAFKSSVPEEDIRNRFQEAIATLPMLEAINERLDKIISPDLFNSKVGAALEALPTKEHIETRLESGFAAITSDMVLARLNQALEAFPSSDQVMDRLSQSLDAMPSADAVLSRVEQRMTSLMPTKDEITATVREVLAGKVEATFSAAEVEEALAKVLPTTDQILDVMRGALPERDRFQEILTQSLAQAIHESLPERVWLETVSRGLFDERTRGSLPKKEEVVDLLRHEIRGKLLEAVEKTVREQIEKISTDLSS
ncbi:MAG: response regulator [Desulfomonile tiedjei]|nr:response regulator [Desulfomonile tiedjei]